MKKLIILIDFTTSSFSQEKELTISEIDTIVKTIRPKIESSAIFNQLEKIIHGFGSTHGSNIKKS